MVEENIKLEGIVKDSFLAALKSASTDKNPVQAVYYAMSVARVLQRNLINENEISKLGVIEQAEKLKGKKIRESCRYSVLEAYFKGADAEQISSDDRIFE